MGKKFNFVYVTTNLINGKQYIGDHSTNNLEKDNYLGSGRPYFQNALNAYGKENFKREILDFFDNKEDAFYAQEKYITKYNTLSPNGYNISTKGGYGVKDCWSEESKKKSSKTQRGRPSKNKGKKLRPLSEEHRRKISIAKKGVKLKYKKRKILSEEHKLKLSEKLKGRKKPVRTEEHRKNISEANKGRKHTDIAKKHMAESHIGKKRGPHSIETKEKLRLINLGKTHTKETKKKMSESRRGKKRGKYNINK